MSVVDLAAAVAAFLIAGAATAGATALLPRLGVLDVPGPRSSHVRVTPRGGGIAFLVAIGVGMWIGDVLTTVVVTSYLGGVGLAVVGFIDDVRKLGARVRLLLQFAIAAAMLPGLMEGFGGPGWWAVLFALATWVWIAGFTNTMNFMDGINGHATVGVILTALTWLGVGVAEDLDILITVSLVTGAAAAGFLPFNFPNARLFMGDVGSYFWGGWLAGLVVLAFRLGAPPVAVLAPLVIFGADAGVTLLRRIRAGASWKEPHRWHTYQRLVDAGRSHARVTLIVAAFITAAAGAGSIALAGTPASLIAATAVMAIVAAYLKSPDLLPTPR